MDLMDSMLQLSKISKSIRIRTVLLLLIATRNSSISCQLTSENSTEAVLDETTRSTSSEFDESSIVYISSAKDEVEDMSILGRNNIKNSTNVKSKSKNNKKNAMREAVQVAALQGLDAMIDLYERKEPEIYKKG